MDLNLVVLAGEFATTPELRSLESGDTVLRSLVTVRSETPQRVDVIPVTLWNPNRALLDHISGLEDRLRRGGGRGQRLWVAGRVQRRFTADAGGRKSRIEVVADRLELPDPDDCSWIPVEH